MIGSSDGTEESRLEIRNGVFVQEAGLLIGSVSRGPSFRFYRWFVI